MNINIKVSRYSCGIIINYEELIRSEGFMFVSKFIEKTIKNLDDETKYICYDNACHLFGVNNELKDTTFVIDRFHIKTYL
jgi:hypothetical protein